MFFRLFKKSFDLSAEKTAKTLFLTKLLNFFYYRLTVSASDTKVHFKDVFPVSLSPVEFDATMTDIDYVTAEVIFKYSIYDIEVDI